MRFRRCSAIRRLLPALFLSACLLAAFACSDSTKEDALQEKEVIAEVAGQPVTLAQFETYAEAATQSGDEEGEAPEERSAELMSRLLERFLDEELIIREAATRGVTVTEREVTDSLRRLHRPTGAEGAPADEGMHAGDARQRMRRALLVRKFREEQVLRDLSVTDEEVAAYYDAHRDEFHQEARVVLRQILLDDETEARKVREDAARAPARFAEIAEELSLAPDGGRPRAYAEEELPPEILQAVASVPEGNVSEMVVDPLGSRIFMVEKRQPERLVGVEEASDRIRVALLQEKGRRAYAEFMERLRAEAGLKVHENRIPFEYTKRAS